MASPFSIFRKHQQILMVALVILAMLAFTLDDFLRGGGYHPAIFAAILGAAIFCIAGIGRGRWMQYGIAGAVLGAILGFVMPGVFDRTSGGTTTSTLGTYSPQRKRELINRELAANQFLISALREAFPEDTEESNTSLQRQLQAYHLGFMQNQNMPTSHGVLFAEMLRAEADAAGIIVTDRMVNDYINQATDQRLSEKGFAAARRSVHLTDGTGQQPITVTEDVLYDLLREQIQARMAYSLLQPMASSSLRMFSIPGNTTPEALYSFHKRFNTTQRMNIATVEVDDFIDSVGEPTDAQITTLFEENRTKGPNTDGPGSPGFMQMEKVKLAWLEIDEKDIEATVAAVTDAEIEAYYEENKEVRFRRPVVPAAPENTEEPAEGTPAEGDSKPEGTSESPEGSAPVPSEPATSPESATPTEEKKEDAAPAAEGAAPAPTPESPTPEATPPQTPVNGETPAEPKAESPAEPAPSTEPAPESDNECNPFLDESATPAATPVEETSTPTTDEAPAATEAPAAASAPADESEKPADGQETAPTADTPAEASSPAAADEGATKPGALTIPDAPPADLPAGFTAPEMTQET
ncbi:MAG: hypothetical protein KDA85_10530, partial [Planctomycetaceae bacterium]|nr:hypothetical protein [Planctomycetaceae bacterium]